MFAVLELYKVGNSFKEKLRKRFLKPSISVDRLSIYDGMHYYIIRAPIIDGEIDWKGIGEAAGGHKKRMLIPHGVEVPEDSGIVRFKPRVFQRIILFNTAVSLLALSDLIPSETVISVIDYDMLDTERIYSLLPYASIVKVVTRESNIEAYNCFSDNLYNETGARLIVTDDISAVKNSNLILTAEEVEDENLSKCRVLSFYPLNNTPKALCIGCIELTHSLNLPFYEGIPMIDFLGALYELCPPSERLTPIRAKTLITDHFELTVFSAANLLSKDLENEQ